MIKGVHTMYYSSKPEELRAFVRDKLGFTSFTDVGGGWLIFALPPTELAFHPAEDNGKHQLSLVCDDVEALVAEMRAKDVPCSEIKDQGWGRITVVTLPGGGELGIYQPKHASPL